MEVSLEYLFIFDPEKFPTVEKPDEADLMDAKIEFFYPPLEDKHKQRNLVGMAEGFLLFFNSFKKPEDIPIKQSTSFCGVSELTQPVTLVPKEATKLEENSMDQNIKSSISSTKESEQKSDQKEEQEILNDIEILCREEINIMTLQNSLLLIQKFEKKFLVLILANPKRMRRYSFGSSDTFVFPDNIEKEVFSRLMKHFVLSYVMFRGSFQRSFSSEIQKALFSESFVHYIEKYFGKKSFESLRDSQTINPPGSQQMDQSAQNDSKNASSIENLPKKAQNKNEKKAENKTPNLVLPSLSNSNIAFNSNLSSRPLNLWEFSIPKIFKGKIPRKIFLMMLQELTTINDNSIYDIIIFTKNDLIYYKKCKELALFFSQYLFDVSDSLNQETCTQSELKKFLNFLGLQMDSHIFYDQNNVQNIPRRFSRNFEETGDSFYRTFNSKEKGKFFQQEKGRGMPFYIPRVLFKNNYKVQHFFETKE
jgi:hypothetical protein